MKIIFSLLFLAAAFCSVFSQTPLYKFASIGDYGKDGANEQAVSDLVRSWSPDFVITLGDNNYENGASSTIDLNIGKYYHEFIYPYTGSYGQGDTVNRFFPSLGNHDWNTAGAVPYLNYFALPNNERYYDFVKGNVHFYSIDSDPHETDGIDSSSVQALWLKNKLAASTEKWKIVYFHHPPYTSGSTHGPTLALRWPFKSWGASIVMAGHEHIYERLSIDNLIYIVNGLGGKSIYPMGTPVTGSLVRYNADYGAMLMNVYNDSINFKFINRSGNIIDNYTLNSTVVGIAQTVNEIPGSFNLDQNYPNPFNPNTVINYSMSEGGFVSLKVYDILGRIVAAPVNEFKSAGKYSVNFSGNGLNSGIYYYSIEITPYENGGRRFTYTRRMILLK
ncbi:MAG: metallophosphoesterase [Bacteroidetes bacterium]|nr:metallophosphoesterase [Bacteroidota bacterium]